MNHYILNGLQSDLEIWLERLPYMSENEAMATVPDEVLEFTAIAQSEGLIPNNGWLSAVASGASALWNTVKPIGGKIIRGGKKIIGIAAKNPKLTSAATNFVANKSKGIAGAGKVTGAISTGVVPPPKDYGASDLVKALLKRSPAWSRDHAEMIAKQIEAGKMKNPTNVKISSTGSDTTGGNSSEWFKNPIVLVGGGLLLYKLINK